MNSRCRFLQQWSLPEAISIDTFRKFLLRQDELQLGNNEQWGGE